MTYVTLTESIVEDAAIDWTVKHDTDIAHDEISAEQSGYKQIMLGDRLHQFRVE